jgi:hypothetical protein
VAINREFVYAEAEAEATKNIFELAESHDVVFWLSPPSEPGGVYNDGGRFKVGLVKRDGEDITIEGKAIVIRSWDRQKWLEVAKGMEASGGEILGNIDTVEDLRRQPLAIDLNGRNWIDACEETIPILADDWTYLRMERDKQKKEKVVETAKIVYKECGGNNVLFEIGMALRGFAISGGNHGGTWSSGAMSRITGFEIKMVGGQFIGEKVKIDGKYVCPICNVELSEGATSCYKCGLRLGGGGSG